MTVVHELDIQDSLASLAAEPGEESLEHSVINSFETPELAFFDIKTGPTLLSFDLDGIKVKTNDPDKGLKEKLVCSFLDSSIVDESKGLMMRRVNGDTYFGVNFEIENPNNVRGRKDLYLLFAKCNDYLINTELLEKELYEVAGVYSSLINSF